MREGEIWQGVWVALGLRGKHLLLLVGAGTASCTPTSWPRVWSGTVFADEKVGQGSQRSWRKNQHGN